MKTLEHDFDQLNAEFGDLQSNIENKENSLRKNNTKLQCLKEGIEGENLVHYLEELFMGYLGANWNINIQIVFQIGSLNKKAK